MDPETDSGSDPAGASRRRDPSFDPEGAWSSHRRGVRVAPVVIAVVLVVAAVVAVGIWLAAR